MPVLTWLLDSRGKSRNSHTSSSHVSTLQTAGHQVLVCSSKYVESSKVPSLLTEAWHDHVSTLQIAGHRVLVRPIQKTKFSRMTQVLTEARREDLDFLPTFAQALVQLESWLWDR